MLPNLFFEESGQGKAFICLHAYALDHTIWSSMAKDFSKSARVILPDLRGHGKSPAPTGKYTMREMGEDILYLMDSLDIEKAVIVGHSMGGYIALAMARYYSDRLSGIALVASHAFEDSPEKKKSRILDIEKLKLSTVDEVLSGMADKLSKNIEIIENCKVLISKTSINGVIGVLAGMAERSESIDVLYALMIPKLVIAGVEDQIIPKETNLKMVEMVKNLNLIEISGAGHMPMMEKPHETAKALENLL